MIPGLGRSPGEGKGYPVQYSGLGNSMDFSVGSNNWTQLSDFHLNTIAYCNYMLYSIFENIFIFKNIFLKYTIQYVIIACNLIVNSYREIIYYIIIIYKNRLLNKP